MSAAARPLWRKRSATRSRSGTGGHKVHLLKVNTQVRGSGHVGEMTDLIVQAFAQAEHRADTLRGKPLLLLIDEADALAAKRVDQHMHHEDKAGMNTLLQRIDNLRMSNRRIAVIFITNRPDALDPAVHRRAALRLTFDRPNDEVRAAILRQSLPELRLTDKNVQELVRQPVPPRRRIRASGSRPLTSRTGCCLRCFARRTRAGVRSPRKT